MRQKILFAGRDHRGRCCRGADLRYRGLNRLDLRGADLRDTDLRGADMTGADLRGADLRGANLQSTDLWRTRFAGAELGGTCLIHCDEDAAGRIPKFNIDRWVQVLGGAVIDGMLLGFRSAEAMYADRSKYVTGRLYAAPVFSADASMECHPGLHFCHSVSWLEYLHGVSVDAAIRVAVDPLDALSAGDGMAFRCRKFYVVGRADDGGPK